MGGTFFVDPGCSTPVQGGEGGLWQCKPGCDYCLLKKLNPLAEHDSDVTNYDDDGGGDDDGVGGDDDDDANSCDDDDEQRGDGSTTSGRRPSEGPSTGRLQERMS